MHADTTRRCAPVVAALPEPWEPAAPLPLAMATLLLCVAALPAPAPDAAAPPARHVLLNQVFG